MPMSSITAPFANRFHSNPSSSSHPNPPDGPNQNQSGWSQPQQYSQPGPSNQPYQPYSQAPGQQQQQQMQPNARSSQNQSQPNTQIQSQSQQQSYNPYNQQNQQSYGRPNMGYQSIGPYGAPAQPQPQPLESAGQDEHPVYGPLGRAKGKITRALEADEAISPDLETGLVTRLEGQQGIDLYAPLPGANVAFRPLKVRRKTPLPQDLFQQLNYKHEGAKNGLFEEIGRAWFTVDHKLFLWNYVEGRAFVDYTQSKDRIACVGLVKARKDVFLDLVSHVLIICTKSQLVMFAVSQPSQTSLDLFDTKFAIDLPAEVLSISGTSNGRIFMVCADKNLWEVEYSNREGSWFFGSSANIRLHNRSSGSWVNWGLSFSSSKQEGVESIAVDSTRNRVYTLRTRGEIDCFDITGMDTFLHKSTHATIRQTLLNHNRAPGAKQDTSNIVKIAIIDTTESSRRGLVAIFASGARAYIAVGGMPGNVVLRLPPMEGLELLPNTFYSSGTFIGVQAGNVNSTDVSRLHCVIPHPGYISASRENHEHYAHLPLHEWYVEELATGVVYDIAESSPTNPSYVPAYLRRTDAAAQGVGLAPLAQQFTSDTRQFVMLARDGVYFATQSKPIDMLREAVESDRETAIDVTQAAFGKTQLTAMAIELGATADLREPDMASAVSAMLIGARAPVIREVQAVGRSIVYSGRHDGLALTLARLLRPIWKSRVTAATIMGGRQIQVLAIPQSRLSEVQGSFRQLKQYLDEHPFPSAHAEGEAKIPWEQEALSLNGLGILMRQAVEAISFILLLNDFKLSDIVSRCDENVRNTLPNLTYEDFLTGSSGNEVARRLVRALVEQQLAQGTGIDALSERLQQACGSFIQPEDVIGYKAEESMRRAESTRDPQERQSALNDSLLAFYKAGASMKERLPEISKRYQAMQYVPGTIELALRTAAAVDPNDKALDFVRDNKHPSDPRGRFFEARKECYDCITSALEAYDQRFDEATAAGNPSAAASKRDEAYAMAIASNDVLFHYALYDWHNDRDQQEQLFEYDTPFLEEYLQKTKSVVPGRRDLLWRFYARREDYLNAAKTLSELATTASDLVLQERTYYLAQALTSAKSAALIGSEDVDFISGLQERLEVAAVQNEVGRGLEVAEMPEDEKRRELKRLNGSLLGLNELYLEFARPYRLYEPILSILKTAETRVEDVCQAVWLQLLRNHRGQLPHLAMSQTIMHLCRTYYGSEAAPADIIIPVIFDEALNFVRESTPGWASKAMAEGGVELREIWSHARESRINASTAEDLEFWDEELGAIAEKWEKDQDTIPGTEISNMADAFIMKHSDIAPDDRKAITRERFARARDAIGRF